MISPFKIVVSIMVIGVSAVLTSAAERPNVLFIAIDDLNDWVGCLGGHPQAQTPNIDRLARRGTLFSNAHTQAPLCNPSRTSVLTGLRPSTTGVYALEPWFRTSSEFKDLVTLPQYFSAHGYRTLVTGKIFHDGYPPYEAHPSHTEFDVVGVPGSHGPYPAKKLVETPSKMNAISWGVFPEHDEDQDDSKVTQWAVDRLKEKPGKQPLFLFVGLRRPHLPCYASQKWFDLYPEETLQLPPVKVDDVNDTPQFSRYLHWILPEPTLEWLQTHHQWKPLVRAYLACVSFTDFNVGRLLDALDASGQADNTIIVLWSDHGWHIGEKGMTGKTTLWERSTHVPLIWAGPGITADARCQQPVELLDIYPTLIDVCALPTKSGLEGHSLAPQLRDAGALRTWPAVTTHGPGNHAVRTYRYRYIRYADGSEELYDHETDPNEWTNLASDPGRDNLKRNLAMWLPQSNHDPLPGSKTRLVQLKNGKVYWETVLIQASSQPD